MPQGYSLRSRHGKEKLTKTLEVCQNQAITFGKLAQIDPRQGFFEHQHLPQNARIIGATRNMLFDEA